MKENEMRQAGPLQAVEVYQEPNAKWVVLFHGYGADANDLSSLSEAVRLQKPCNWLFPNGHLSVPIGPGWTGRAWWNIRMAELPSDWSTQRPEGMEQAVDKAFKMFSSMKLDWANTIIGGFSQGAMLATEVFLKAPETPAGLICMSGTLLNKTVWSEFASQRKQSSVFLSHGEMDQVLPHKGSLDLQKFLESYDIQTQFASFKGGHEIPMNVIQKIEKYIQQRL